jgi:hypothetical protein
MTMKEGDGGEGGGLRRRRRWVGFVKGKEARVNTPYSSTHLLNLNTREYLLKIRHHPRKNTVDRVLDPTAVVERWLHKNVFLPL